MVSLFRLRTESAPMFRIIVFLQYQIRVIFDVKHISWPFSYNFINLTAFGISVTSNSASMRREESIKCTLWGCLTLLLINKCIVYLALPETSQGLNNTKVGLYVNITLLLSRFMLSSAQCNLFSMCVFESRGLFTILLRLMLDLWSLSRLYLEI